jgi:hypothetical protein
VGFCSYPDDACPSGARFSPNASGDFADACVEPGGGTTSTDGGSNSGESSGEPPVAGELVWERGFASASVRAIAVDGVVVAAGTRLSPSPVPWLVGVTLDGGDAFGPVALEERTTTVAYDVVVAGDAITVAGAGDGAGGLRAWTARFNGAGQLLDETLVDTLASDAFASVVTIAAVGRQADAGWIRWFDGRPDVTEAGVDFTAAASRLDGAVGIVDATGGFRVLTPGGAAELRGISPVAALSTIAFGGDGGFVVGGRSTVAAFDVAGALRWSRDVVGVVRAVAADRVTPDVFVATAEPGAITRLAADGADVWSASPSLETVPVVPTDLAIATSGDLFVSGDAQGTGWVARIDP